MTVEKKRALTASASCRVLAASLSIAVILAVVVYVLLSPVVFSPDIMDQDNVAKQNITIKLGFIGPLQDSLGATATLGKELASAFKIAIELINEEALSSGSNVRLSTDYKSMIKDGGSNPTTTCKIAAQQLAADSDVVGVIGGFRSLCSMASHMYFRNNAASMTQISYGSTAIELSNKMKFPRFFRTCASDANQATALADLVTHFNWRRISTIATMDNNKNGLADKFEYEAKLKGIRIFASARFSAGANSDIVEQKVQMLKDAQTRINIVTALPHDSLKIFQKAKEKGMTRQGWVWLGSDVVMATPQTNQVDVKKAMEGTVGIMPKGGSGKVYLKILVKWLSKRDKKNYPGIIHHVELPKTSAYVAQVYDAVYAYFLAFDRLARQGKISAADAPSKLRKIVFDQLKQFKNPASGFVGAQGMYTYFDKNFDGPPVYDIGNIQGGRWEDVGTWNRTIGIEQNEKTIVWPGNTKVPPTDKGLPGKTTFRIGFLGPVHPNLAGLSQLGKEFESAFRVAVEMMNKDLSLSVDFDVRIQDSGVDPEKSCKLAAEDLVRDDVVAVIGAYRSSCSVAAAKVLGLDSNQVPQVSYGSTSPSLSDKTKYKYFYRTCSSDVHQASALAALFKKYRWPEVGTIATDDTYGSGLMGEFSREVVSMDDVPVSVVSKQEFPVNARAAVVRPKVQQLKASGSKVNLIGMVRQNAETVFQQIKELGMTGKGWIWLGSDGATTSTFERQRELERAMEGMVGTQPKNGEGSLYLKFLAAWLKKDSTTYPGMVHSRQTRPSSAAFTAQLFDSVHGIALALSDLVNKKVISRTTDVQTVREKLHEKLMTFNDKSTGYPSATGNKNVMYFDQNQDGPPLVDIVNLVGSNWITVGQYNSKKNDITLRKDPVFPGGTTLPNVGGGRPTYKIAGFFPKHDSLGALASLGVEWESAFRVAVELVNRDASFKVAFSYVNIDGGPSAESCRKAAENLPNGIDLIIGEARSSCSIAIAEATEDLGIPQVSYASTSTRLSDKHSFPNFFRTCARDEHQGVALAKLVQRYKWGQVGTIATMDAYAEDLSRKFALEVRKIGVEISADQQFEMHTKASIAEEVRALKSGGSSVSLVTGATDDAEKVFQEAIEQGMTGKGWTWLGTDGATSSSFSMSPNLETAMQGMVGTRPQNGHGPLYQKLLKAWSEKDAEAFPGLVHSSRVQQASAYVAQVYDAVLAYAHALTRLHEAGTIDKTSSRVETRRLLMTELKKMKDPSTGFTGATGGQQFFDSYQDGPPVYDVVNLNGESWNQVGTYSPQQGLSLKKNIVWSGGSLTTPSDQQPGQEKTDLEEVTKSNESGVGQGGLVALGAVFGVFATAMMAFIVFLIYRERTGNPSFGPRVFRRSHASPVNEITDVMNNGVYRPETEKTRNPEFV